MGTKSFTFQASTMCSTITARCFTNASARGHRVTAGTASIKRAFWFHWPGQRAEPQSRRSRQSWQRLQLEWLEKDVAKLKSSTPIVVFAHIPLWFSIYPEWGWGTDDSARALSYLQTIWLGYGFERTHSPDHAERWKGTSRSTPHARRRSPQPAPGTPGASPGPMKVPDDKLRGLLGITDVNFVRGEHTLAIVDSTLQD